MPYILVEDFRAGLDTRRTEITSIPGSARTLTNCHISRGGEIEKRKAFVTYATLPTGTHGLATAGGQVYVFGSGATPDMSSVPENVNYIRFQPPSGVSSTTMTEVLGVDFLMVNPMSQLNFRMEGFITIGIITLGGLILLIELMIGMKFGQEVRFQ